MDLTHAAAAQAASHLTSHQVVPGLAIITVLLLTLVIVFGPRNRDRDPAPRQSPAGDRPVHAADPRDPAKDVAGPVSGK
jgi:hypothetical protein